MRKIPLFLLICAFFIPCRAEVNQAVTYELSPGRFGDNLLSYIHAKWISHTYQLPLLYKPFIYSDHLMIDELELSYAEYNNRFNTALTLSNNSHIDTNHGSVLYTVPYFPSSKYELMHGISFSGGAWYFFKVDWSDTLFIEKLQQAIAPNHPIPSIHTPDDRISVAIHIRRGGNHDTPETLLAFPLKFLSDEFYREQLKNLYFLLNESPLYVYIFTDDNDPIRLLNMMQNNCTECDIQFDCRKEHNADTMNVIEDFFMMQQFDCLIHSESNYSFIMSKIGNYLVSIFPDSFKKEQNKIIYDNINITINYNHEKATKLK